MKKNRLSIAGKYRSGLTKLKANLDYFLLLELIENKGGLLKSGYCLATSSLQTITFFESTIKTSSTG